MTRIAVLISGSGTNLQAIIDATSGGRLPGVEIAVVVSNRKAAYGLQRAEQAGIPTEYRPLKPYRDEGRSRRDYDADLAALLCDEYGVEWVIQAGWMHLFGMVFLERFPNRVINLHPALPGAFPGTHAIESAWEAYQGGEIDHTGVMIHLVPDEGVDSGPVVAQTDVSIHPDDTLETLEARIHATEHRLLVQALHDRLCPTG
ncbi:MAG: phosphoribosylglycinamide formyltransferase [Anaerolineae bacterium]|nr:phosphoribosylglycinamide formyltransferase [Anaerolineae bacterium]